MGAPPPKYVPDPVTKVMRRNPEYDKFMQSQGTPSPNGKVVDMSVALPVVSNMEEYEQFNNALVLYQQPARPMAASQASTMEMMQDPDMANEVHIATDEWIDALGAVFAKYETPIGLMNKLFQLQKFDALEFVIDDSGSMTLDSDMKGPNGRFLSRWQEMQHRMKELLEILAYIPTKTIRICFLNRSDVLTFDRHKTTLSPQQFIQFSYQKIDEIFSRRPNGRTPYVAKIKSCLQQDGRVAYYFFSDGQPTDMQLTNAVAAIKTTVMNRRDPENNPVTFLSCTNEDQEVEWMKEVEEVAKFCAEVDDYEDEAREVQKDQGRAFPFTKGFYLIASLVGAMNPEDLDAMDETVPFAKATLDNMLGMQSSTTEYNHYFQHFLQAQREASNQAQQEARSSGERVSPVDQFKYTYNWQPYFEEFVSAVNRETIPAVQAYRAQLYQLNHPNQGGAYPVAAGVPPAAGYPTAGHPSAPPPYQAMPGGYPQPGYPQQQPVAAPYPPQHQAAPYPPPQQPGYPPQQPGYPPQQGYPAPAQQPGYPPQQSGYPPQQPGLVQPTTYPPSSSGSGYAYQQQQPGARGSKGFLKGLFGRK